MVQTRRYPRNDPRQYDDLVSAWWDPQAAFAMLHWIAAARARLVPVASRHGEVLVDLGCGAGLLAPHVEPKGYRHVGLDLNASALRLAREHGVAAVRGDVLAVPLADGCADVVCAGEILEHVADLDAAVAESCRLLRPGGLLVLDTIAATRLARLLAVGVAERIPGGAPPGIHDPALFVDRRRLLALARSHGVALELSGLRPALGSIASWKLGLGDGRVVPSRFTSVLFQGVGRKESR